MPKLSMVEAQAIADLAKLLYDFLPGTFALENNKGEKVEALHSGTKGVLYCPCANVPQGAFIRTIQPLSA